jgi:hypothetical protein
MCRHACIFRSTLWRQRPALNVSWFRYLFFRLSGRVSPLLFQDRLAHLRQNNSSRFFCCLCRAKPAARENSIIRLTLGTDFPGPNIWVLSPARGEKKMIEYIHLFSHKLLKDFNFYDSRLERDANKAPINFREILSVVRFWTLEHYRSKTEVAALRRDVCFTPVSGHRQAVSAGPKSAPWSSELG